MVEQDAHRSLLPLIEEGAEGSFPAIMLLIVLRCSRSVSAIEFKRFVSSVHFAKEAYLVYFSIHSSSCSFISLSRSLSLLVKIIFFSFSVTPLRPIIFFGKR